MHIVVVEDEKALCDTIARSLRPVSYTHLQKRDEGRVFIRETAEKGEPLG